LSVVRCAPSQSAKKTIGEKMFTKIEDKNCKIIVDSETCISAISFKSLENLGLEVVPHSHPFKVSWIDSTILEVKQQCLVPVNFNHYKDKIWCDVITIVFHQRKLK